jgi:aspartokinase/homoserine dehydrogenase 1
MKVMKFGGTSVGSIDSILTIKQIVESQEEPVVVVVSAVGGVTDRLIRASQLATAGDPSYNHVYQEIREKH